MAEGDLIARVRFSVPCLLCEKFDSSAGLPRSPHGLDNNSSPSGLRNFALPMLARISSLPFVCSRYLRTRESKYKYRASSTCAEPRVAHVSKFLRNVGMVCFVNDQVTLRVR